MKQGIVSLTICYSLVSLAALKATPNDEVSTFTTTGAQDEFNAWVKHGELFLSVAKLKSGPIRLYSYKVKSGECVILNNNISGINGFLKREIDAKESARSFLKKQFFNFIFDLMSTRDSIVVTKLDTAGLGPLNFKSEDQYGDQSISKASDREILEMNKRIDTYISSENITQEGNKWSFDFNVFTTGGGIEHWQALGQIFPLQISSFCREVKEPDGTFPRYSTMW